MHVRTVEEDEVAMSLRGSRRRTGMPTMVASLLSLAIAATACTNTSTPQDSAPSSAPSSTTPRRPLPEAGIPQVVPQPQQMNRLGEDIAVRGKVEVVVDPLVDQPTRDLAVQVFRAAGADDVVIREPGAKVEGAELTVRIGDRIAPMVAKGLQAVGFVAPPAPLPPEGYVLAGRGGDEPTLVLGASDPSGIYYAVQTLRQLTTPGRIAGVGVVDSPSMPLRGTVEGFYGRPWSHQERMDQLAFYGDVKLNTYIYAPKDDPYHRELWRQPYPSDKLGEVQELIRQAGEHHVKFTFALSPGNSICYSNPADWSALVGKLQAMYDSGVRDFSIPFDDISYTRWNCPGDEAKYGKPSEGSAGQAQADVLNRVQHEFVDTHPGTAPLQMVPTEYSDLEDSRYKKAIRTLDPRVQVMWTGDGVIPEEITVSQAKQATEVWGRKPFVWDNYPVNDFEKSVGRLLVGPYAKREPGLHEHLSGIAVNPMNQAAASKVVEIGAADFAWNDEMYVPERAWRLAAEYLAGDRFVQGSPSFVADPATVESLLVFFDLEHMSPLASGRPWQEPAPGLLRRLDAFRAGWVSGDRAGAVAELRGYAQAIADAPERIRSGAAEDFVSDAGPWLDATDLWGRSLLATVDGLQARVDADEARAGQLFAQADALAAQASAVRTTPGETLPQGPVHVADGVLDVFIQQAPGLR